MAYSTAYLEANRETINYKRRTKYSSVDRKAEYREKRLDILKQGKEDRAICPLCGLDFRRLYIKKHIMTRHKCNPPEDLDAGLERCVPIATE